MIFHTIRTRIPHYLQNYSTRFDTTIPILRAGSLAALDAFVTEAPENVSISLA